MSINNLKSKLFICSILIIIVCTGCTKNIPNDQNNQNNSSLVIEEDFDYSINENVPVKTVSDGTVEVYPLESDFLEHGSPYMYLDNAIYYRDDEKANSPRYYCINTDGEKTLIQERNDFVVSGRGNTYNAPFLYSFIGVQPKHIDYIAENVLIQYNTETEKVREFYIEEPVSVPIMCCSPLGNDIVFLKKSKEGEEIISSVGIFDSKKEEWKSIRECTFNTSSQTGNVWCEICSDGKYIYGLYKLSTGPDSFTLSLVKMDADGNDLFSVQLDANSQKYITESFIKKFVVYEEYVYICNASNLGILFHIEDGKLKELYHKENLRMAESYDGSAPLYYIRSEKSVFRINEKGELEETELALSEDENIVVMFSAKDTCFVECEEWIITDNSESYNKMAYVFNRNDLEHLHLNGE